MGSMGSMGSMGPMASGYGGNGGAGASTREGGLTPGWLAAFGTGGYEDEPPLLEELGINFGHIKMKVCVCFLMKGIKGDWTDQEADSSSFKSSFKR